MYFLAKWIKGIGGFYPYLPLTNKVPKGNPTDVAISEGIDGAATNATSPSNTTGSDSNAAVEDASAQSDPPIVNKNGKIGEGQPAVLAQALGVAEPLVNIDFRYQDDLDCSDLQLYLGDNNKTQCYGASDNSNPPIDLDGNLQHPATVDVIAGWRDECTIGGLGPECIGHFEVFDSAPGGQKIDGCGSDRKAVWIDQSTFKSSKPPAPITLGPFDAGMDGFKGCNVRMVTREETSATWDCDDGKETGDCEIIAKDGKPHNCNSFDDVWYSWIRCRFEKKTG